MSWSKVISLFSRATFCTVFASLALTGCSHGAYLFQAARGQWEISNRAKPIEDALKNPSIEPNVAKLLKEVSFIKQFGEKRGLKPTKNYEDYADLKRDYAVWVVTGSLPLEFKAKKWSFPLVGSFTYLGWFDKAHAEAYGEKLKEEGLDVDVRGAQAYSTLGWFKDPILSTMIKATQAQASALGYLTNVILHESLHATLYIKKQSLFNECLASFVADAWTPLYLSDRFGERSVELLSYLDAENKSKQVRTILRKTYLTLKQLYGSLVTDEKKIEEKNRILAATESELSQLGIRPRPLNNATLIQYETYYSEEAQKIFQQELDQVHGDWGRFFDRMQSVDVQQAWGGVLAS